MAHALVFSVQEIKDKEGLSFAQSGPVERFVAGLVTPEAARGLFGEAYLGGRVELRLDFSVGGTNILLEGRVAGEWELECSRCLKCHAAAFESVVDETYPATSDRIDAAEEVRQALILSVPVQTLCAPSCRGLCPRCGADLNAGPCGCRKN